MMHVIVGTSQKKRGPAQELKWETVTLEELATLAATQPLFGAPQNYAFSGALSGERAEEFLELAEELVRSPHTFFFEEEKLLKRPSERLAKAGAKVETHAPPKKEESFSMFSVAQVMKARDRKKLWLSLMSALRAGAAPEAVAGMLHWSVRDMLAKGSQAYTKDELRELSRRLVAMYHDSHRGGGELELLLERFALEL